MRLSLFSIYALIFLCAIPTFSQHVKGQIIDVQTNTPIAFATIQFNDNSGVVANMEGFFNISSDDLNTDSILSVSFMGYETQSFTLEKLKKQNHVIKLKEAINQLETVYLSNKVPRTDSIMARVNRNLVSNYQSTDVQYSLFTRQTTYFKANNLEVDIEKSSGFGKKKLETSNKQFQELTHKIVNNPPTQVFTDVLFDLYLKSDNTAKIVVEKATKLKDHKNNLTLETIQSKVSNIVLQHLDTTKTYKVKTGWFKIEDSLSLKKSKEIKQKLEDNSLTNLKLQNSNTLKENLFEKQSLLDFVMDRGAYNYTLSKITTIDERLVYIIAFEPRKNRAKFKGNLYISDEDYAILKLDYSYAKGKIGEKMNLKLLLGVKYLEKVNKGTVIYKKNVETNKYYPYYINNESGKYLYAHRPFKLIENSKIIKNKVAFDIKIEGTIVQKQELMTLNYKVSNDTSFNGITEAKKVDYINLKQYDPSLWKDFTIMEPLEELKKFEVEE